MVKSLAVFAALAASASAFAPAPFMGTRLAAVKPSTSAVTMSVKDLPGISAPLGFFDPLGFSATASDEQVGKWRESELKHGRTAMLAVLGWAVAEVTHFPMYAGASSSPLKAAFEVPFWGWAQIWAFCGFIEFVQAKIKTRPGHVAGDYMGANDLIDASDEGWVGYQTRELNNGRLAMLAIAGAVGQAALFDQTIFAKPSALF